LMKYAPWDLNPEPAD